MLATPCFAGNVTSEYVGSLINTLVHLHKRSVTCEVYFLKNESLISRARNNCASHFLRSDCTHLLFIDADQAWKTSDIDALLNSKHTLVGGTYCKKILPWDLNFNPLPEHDAEFFPDQVRGPEQFAAYAKSVGPEVEVRHLPTGFLLISREVLEALKPGVPSYLAKDNHLAEEHRHWDFFPCGVVGGGYLSEDHFFVEQAREAGHPPYLMTSVIVDHIGNFNYSIPRSLR